MYAGSDDILARVLARGTLPSLSPVALRLVEMASDDAASANDLAALIEKDPGLTIRLLALVNSPVYRGAGGEISSVSRSVVRLGLREVRIMALAVSLRDTLPMEEGGPDYYLFWHTSLHRAVLASLFAKHLKMEGAENAFIGGLISEIGLPLMLRVLTPREAHGFPGFGRSLQDQLTWERSHLGTDHLLVGREVIRRWGLPDILAPAQEVIPLRNESDAPVLSRLTDLARRGAESFFVPDVEITEVHQAARLRFALTDEEVNQILSTSLNTAAEAAGAMEIDLDKEADLLAVLAKASVAVKDLRLEMAPELEEIKAKQGEARQAGQQAFLQKHRGPLSRVSGLLRNLAKRQPAGKQIGEEVRAVLRRAARLDNILDEIQRMAKRHS